MDRVNHMELLAHICVKTVRKTTVSKAGWLKQPKSSLTFKTLHQFCHKVCVFCVCAVVVVFFLNFLHHRTHPKYAYRYVFSTTLLLWLYTSLKIYCTCLLVQFLSWSSHCTGSLKKQDHQLSVWDPKPTWLSVKVAAKHDDTWFGGGSTQFVFFFCLAAIGCLHP